MTAVTVNNRTYSDDSNPVTGLGDGGHRTRLIPLFADSLVEIANQVQLAAQSYRAVSTSAVAIGAGAKTFLIPPNKGFAVGDAVLARQNSNPSNFMIGTVTAFAPTTGLLTIMVAATDFGGSGAVSDWTIAGPAGPRGQRGLIGFAYGWDTDTTAADPGPGLLRANNAALASATALFIDSIDSFGVNLGVVLTGWAGSNSVVKGQLLLRSQTDPTQEAVFDLLGVASAVSHHILTVSYRSGVAAFAAGAQLTLDFRRTGDKGDVGATGVTGAVAAVGDGTNAAPGVAFSLEPGLGFRRQAAGTIRVVASGADLLSLVPATTAEALAGTDALKLMTPARVADAIAARSLGVGGAVVAGDVTLTSASAGALAVTSSAPGFFATLPVATSMSTAGAGVFSIYNAGSYDYGLRDSAGTRLGWIPPRGACEIDLVDKSTAAGVWNAVGAEKIGITAEFMNATAYLVAGYGGQPQAIEIGSGRTLFLTGRSGVYGVVYDSVNRAWGALTLIRSAADVSGFVGISPAAGQALVVSVSFAGTAMEAVILSVVGTMITVNPAASFTLASTISNGGDGYLGGGQLVAVGSSYVLSYCRSASSPFFGCLLAMTISGTTVSFGTEVVISANAATTPRLYVAGSMLRTVTATATSLIVTPYAVSGRTLTAGAAASLGIGSNAYCSFRTLLNSNGNIVAEYINATHYAAVFKLTGTTETVSAVSIGTAPSAGATLANADAIDLGGGKTLFITFAPAGPPDYGAVYANILTDSGGVATAGTELTIAMMYTSSVAALSATAALARVLVSGAVGSRDPYATQLLLNVSGASPVLSGAQTIQGGFTILGFPSDRLGRRSPLVMRAGTAVYALPQSSSVVTLEGLMTTPGSIHRLTRPRSGARAPWVVGASDAESWLGVAFATYGLILNKLEAAA